LVTLDRLCNLERRAAISRVASVIGHLIGTPLQVIAGRAALIQTCPDMATENARRIVEQVERLALRIHRLIGYLTSPDLEVEPRVVSELVAEALSIYVPIAEYSGISIECSNQPPDARVDGNSAMVVLISLLSLAVRLGRKDDTVTLSFNTVPGTAVVFALTLPHFPSPDSPIDRLDPPESGDQGRAEPLQILSVCHAVARKGGGKLDLAMRDATTSTVRYECPCTL
jgi:signal transduction histidine kinase